MNLIELMKQRAVFDALELELKKFSDLKSYKYLKSDSRLALIRKTIRNLPLKITNIKVTSKDKNKHIITFLSDNDRYYSTWDFAEGKFLSKGVNR